MQTSRWTVATYFCGEKACFAVSECLIRISGVGQCHGAVLLPVSEEKLGLFRDWGYSPTVFPMSSP